MSASTASRSVQVGHPHEGDEPREGQVQSIFCHDRTLLETKVSHRTARSGSLSNGSVGRRARIGPSAFEWTKFALDRLLAGRPRRALVAASKRSPCASHTADSQWLTPSVRRQQKSWRVPAAPVLEPPRRRENAGVESARGGSSWTSTRRAARSPRTPRAEMDRLGDEIAELSAHLDAATARLLDLIREFDARGGWGNGFRSCAHWLSWRVGLDPGAAREKVRVARALGACRCWPRRSRAASCRTRRCGP